jgi:hypothetical protein
MDAEDVVVACHQNQRHQNFNVPLLLSRDIVAVVLRVF